MSLITQRVALARSGANDKVICRMASGWAVMGIGIYTSFYGLSSVVITGPLGTYPFFG
ncbi:hypothetical protein SAMN04490179_3954 [Pseudomonas antarctica]|uniref:Uncharacterized protein n=1 Tax=Pseudomonas antarctica TaxID=219572 RepID=A0A1H0AX65_9PSED|nr:hypothetical protein PSAN_44980 [Pseudomonas antarctica]SDN38009.1 hypothetical protein SAMN04490179_3954 [Pseudomonas antarctica]